MGSVQQSLNPGLERGTLLSAEPGQVRPPGSRAPRLRGSHTPKQVRPHVLQGADLGHPPCSGQQRGAGPERAAPFRAEGGAREGEREGKGERELPQMLGIIPLPFGKPQPQPRRVRPAPAPRPDRPAAARFVAMATSPQKSPSVPKSPTPKSPPSRKKDDSFLGKLGGTLARRKKAKEGECGPGRRAAGRGAEGPGLLGHGGSAPRVPGAGERGARRCGRALPGNVPWGRASPQPCSGSPGRCPPGPRGDRVWRLGPATRRRPRWAGGRGGGGACQPGGGVLPWAPSPRLLRAEGWQFPSFF